jgi:hypothetical protein
MNRKKRKGDGMRANPLPVGPSPRRSRAGLPEGWKEDRRPSPPSEGEAMNVVVIMGYVT